MTKDIQRIKIVDPVIQSLLFIFFCYSLDNKDYQTPFLLIVGWQLLSAIVHCFLKFSRKKVIERAINFIFMVSFAGVFFYFKKVKEVYVEVIAGDGPLRIPQHVTILVTIGMVICFWYYIICFREIRSALKRKSKKTRN